MTNEREQYQSVNDCATTLPITDGPLISKANVCHLSTRRLGNVYFISDGDAIKIGYSVSVESRRSDLQSANSAELRTLASFKGAPSDEHLLHSHFAHLRIRGEFFRPDPLLTEFIADIAELGSWIPYRVTLREALADGLREMQRANQKRTLIKKTEADFKARLALWRRDGFPSVEVETAAVRVGLGLTALVVNKRASRAFVDGLAEDFAALESALQR